MTNLVKLLSDSPDKVARRLLGCYLIRSIEDQDIVCRIVETEAYAQTDEASHSYRGLTPRTKVMFGPPGHLYVYFTYGMHHCLNIVTSPKGHASAVLVRALEPISGLGLIQANRQKITNEYLLTNGPGKLCQALAIGREFNGHDLTKKPIRLEIKPEIREEDIMTTTRIGISKAKELKWRFYIKNNPYVSRP